LVAGLVTTVAHQIGTVPLILQAEAYEHAAEPHPHHVETAAWEPQGWAERAAYTGLADVLAATGFGLLLTAGFALRGGAIGWREGVFWGLAGFATFTLAPCLGLPPELPGAAAAPLAERQIWWLAAAGSTGIGLALIAFTRHAGWVLAGAVLLLLPHLYGAPRAIADESTAAPTDLAHRFAVAVTVISLFFWISLGAASGFFYRLFAPSAEAR
jgi:cobalt transporter subunit CbtA